MPVDHVAGILFGLVLPIEPFWKPVEERVVELIRLPRILSAGVAGAGIVGWVGLVILHFARMLTGPDHKILIPAAALLGAPVFAYLLRRAASKGWSAE